MVNCDKCGKKIKDKYDINVVALLGFKPVKLCNSCYASKERGITRHLFYIPPKFPLNSKLYPIGGVFIIIIFLWLVPALLFAGKTLEGEPASIFLKIFITSLFGAFLLWYWVLWFIARSVINKI